MTRCSFFSTTLAEPCFRKAKGQPERAESAVREVYVRAKVRADSLVLSASRTDERLTGYAYE